VIGTSGREQGREEARQQRPRTWLWLVAAVVVFGGLVLVLALPVLLSDDGGAPRAATAPTIGATTTSTIPPLSAASCKSLARTRVKAARAWDAYQEVRADRYGAKRATLLLALEQFRRSIVGAQHVVPPDVNGSLGTAGARVRSAVDAVRRARRLSGLRRRPVVIAVTRYAFVVEQQHDVVQRCGFRDARPIG
jgi:hypothetical protein